MSSKARLLFDTLKLINEGGGVGSVDSQQTINLIEDTVDVDFVNALGITGGGGQLISGGVEQYVYTATANQTIFADSDDNGDVLSFTGQNLAVFLNGVLLVETDDYTVSGSSITLTFNASLNDEITVVTYDPTSDTNLELYFDSDYISSRVGDLYLGKSSIATYFFTTTQGQTSLTGNDDNGNLLEINDAAILVFINGVMLSAPADYTVSNNTINLTQSAALNDQFTVQSFANHWNLPYKGGEINFQSFRYVTTEGQNTFTGNDASGTPLSYNPGSANVFLNGILLTNSQDFTATDGSSITILDSLNAGNEVLIQNNYSKFSFDLNNLVDSTHLNYVRDNIAGEFKTTTEVINYKYVADSNQSVFTGPDINGNSLNYNPNNLIVFLNGINLFAGTDYTQTDANTITLAQGLDSGAELVMYNFNKFYGGAATIDGNQISDGTYNFAIDTNNQGFALTGNIIPTGDELYDLGDSNHKFRDLYLSTGTIYLGNTALGATPTGGIKIGEAAIEVDSTSGGIKLPEGTKLGDTQVPTKLQEMSNFDTEIVPETFVLNADFPLAGHGTDWFWTWDAGRTSYQRTKITNQIQSSVPLYKQGSYIINNFAHELHGDMSQTHGLFLKWISIAGLDHNVDWVNYDSTSVTHPDINGGNATQVQRLQFTVPENITIPELTAPNLNYYMSFDSDNPGAYVSYYHNFGHQVGRNTDLGPFYRGGTYTFVLDSNTSGHPFYLTTDDGTNFAGGSYYGEYTHGVVNSRAEGSDGGYGQLVWTIPDSAPDTMYYQCGIHAAMQGEITIKDLKTESDGTGRLRLYLQHYQEGHDQIVEVRPKPGFDSSDNMTLIFDAASKTFKAKDIGEYLDETPQLKAKIEDIIKTNTSDKVTASDVTTQIKDELLTPINLHTIGELELLTGSTRWYAPYNLQISVITAKLGTAADNTVTIQAKKNGNLASAFDFNTGETTANVTNQSISMNQGDYLTVDVTAIGTTQKGEDLYMQFMYKRL